MRPGQRLAQWRRLSAFTGRGEAREIGPGSRRVNRGAILPTATVLASELPPHHRDRLDRLLIAPALSEPPACSRRIVLCPFYSGLPTLVR